MEKGAVAEEIPRVGKPAQLRSVGTPPEHPIFVCPDPHRRTKKKLLQQNSQD